MLGRERRRESVDNSFEELRSMGPRQRENQEVFVFKREK